MLTYDRAGQVFRHGEQMIGCLLSSLETDYRGPVMAASEDLLRLADDLTRIPATDAQGVKLCQSIASRILATIKSQQP